MAASVTSPARHDVNYDDEDELSVSDKEHLDLEQSGSGDEDVLSRPYSDWATAHRGTEPATPIGELLYNRQRFRHLANDSYVTTASSSTSPRSMTSLVTSFLLSQLVLTLLRTRLYTCSLRNQDSEVIC